MPPLEQLGWLIYVSSLLLGNLHIYNIGQTGLRPLEDVVATKLNIPLFFLSKNGSQNKQVFQLGYEGPGYKKKEEKKWSAVFWNPGNLFFSSKLSPSSNKVGLSEHYFLNKNLDFFFSLKK